ncbi:MAG: hypothetical protein JEY97_12105 [Bacteroidales bacterium]|nr:hypothetical protein [Bacteroidales bacterium]
MNKLLITIIGGIYICLTINFSHAQKAPADRGSILYSAGLNFSAIGGDLYESGNGKIFYLQISQSYVRFLQEGLGVGSKVIFGYQKQDRSSLVSFAGGPQLVYYICSNYQPKVIKGKVYPFISTSALYEVGNYKENRGTQLDQGFIFSLGGGMSVMLTNSVGLNFEAAYQLEKREGQSGNFINFIIGIVAFL